MRGVIIPPTVERLVAMWCLLDQLRERSAADGRPWPTLEQEMAAREGLAESRRADR